MYIFNRPDPKFKSRWISFEHPKYFFILNRLMYFTMYEYCLTCRYLFIFHFQGVLGWELSCRLFLSHLQQGLNKEFFKVIWITYVNISIMFLPRYKIYNKVSIDKSELRDWTYCRTKSCLSTFRKDCQSIRYL